MVSGSLELISKHMKLRAFLYVMKAFDKPILWSQCTRGVRVITPYSSPKKRDKRIKIGNTTVRYGRLWNVATGCTDLPFSQDTRDLAARVVLNGVGGGGGRGGGPGSSSSSSSSSAFAA